MGFSDIGCYGGEIDTPNLDALGRSGVRFTQFYNSPRCSPSRASLLTGLHPHQVGIGILTGDERPFGYAGNLSEQCVTAAEVLRTAGYRTYMSGKWHLCADTDHPNSAWPTRRGFEQFFGTLQGGGSYHTPRTLSRNETSVMAETNDPAFFYTDAIADNAVAFIDRHTQQAERAPMFLYCAFTAPHWPLHAPKDEIARYRGRYDRGWDHLRRARMSRLIAEGIIDPLWDPSNRDPRVLPWQEVREKEWQASRMEVYAAQVSKLDSAVGRICDALRRHRRLENTLLIFLSDNGGCAEDIPAGPESPFRHLSLVPKHTRNGRMIRIGNTPQIIPGPEDTYASYGIGWANLSNTPFREYKHWVHEGGISTPLIMHWPARLKAAGSLCHAPRQLVDLLPTFLDVAEARYPEERRNKPLPPLEGTSLLPVLDGEQQSNRDLWWEHEGNAGLRRGRWKLVRKYPGDWELYNMETDRTELHNVAFDHQSTVEDLSNAYRERADRYGVIPREHVLQGQQAAHAASSSHPTAQN